MKNNSTTFILCFLMIIFSCKKNLTNYFADNEKNGLSIFSNKGNNILTAYINDGVWRTRDRLILGITGRIDYEINIEKHRTGSIQDTLIFSWYGTNINNNYESLILKIAVDSNFSFKDFKPTFEGKRLIIDSTLNGFFTLNINSLLPNNIQTSIKGNGVIFFQSAPNNLNNIAGLLTAKIGNIEIKEGRFDHTLNGLPINF